jgi:hypothetical protein
MTEHRWKDITGGAVDDADWRALRTLPSFGDGSAASLAAGQITRLAPKQSAIVAWFELYDGQAPSDAPVVPTPAVTATLEVVTYTKDQAGNVVYAVGAQVELVPNQRKAIEVEAIAQGISFVRVTSIAGAVTDPGSIRVFVSEEVDP